MTHGDEGVLRRNPLTVDGLALINELNLVTPCKVSQAGN